MRYRASERKWNRLALSRSTDEKRAGTFGVDCSEDVVFATVAPVLEGEDMLWKS